MIKLKMKNYSMILIEKPQKYQPYYQAKWINKNILQVKKYYLLIKKQAKFNYSPSGKAFEKQKDEGEKQIDVLKTLKLKDKEEKQIESIEDNKKHQGKSDD